MCVWRGQRHPWVLQPALSPLSGQTRAARKGARLEAAPLSSLGDSRGSGCESRRFTHAGRVGAHAVGQAGTLQQQLWISSGPLPSACVRGTGMRSRKGECA